MNIHKAWKKSWMREQIQPGKSERRRRRRRFYIKIDVLGDGGEIKCFHVLMADIVEYLMKSSAIFSTLMCEWVSCVKWKWVGEGLMASKIKSWNENNDKRIINFHYKTRRLYDDDVDNNDDDEFNHVWNHTIYWVEMSFRCHRHEDEQIQLKSYFSRLSK